MIRDGEGNRNCGVWGRAVGGTCFSKIIRPLTPLASKRRRAVRFFYARGRGLPVFLRVARGSTARCEVPLGCVRASGALQIGKVERVPWCQGYRAWLAINVAARRDTSQTSLLKCFP